MWVFLMGKDGRVCPFSWKSSKIKRVCRSTAAAEGMSLSQGLEEAIYNRNLITEILRTPKKSKLMSAILVLSLLTLNFDTLLPVQTKQIASSCKKIMLAKTPYW